MKSHVLNTITIMALASGQLFMDKYQIIALVMVGIVLMGYGAFFTHKEECDVLTPEGEKFFMFGMALISNICYLFTFGIHPVAGILGNLMVLGMVFTIMYLSATTPLEEEPAA